MKNITETDPEKVDELVTEKKVEKSVEKLDLSKIEKAKLRKQLINKFKTVRKGVFSTFFKFIIIPTIILLLAIRIFIVKTNERELYYSYEAIIQREEVKVGSDGFGNISAINVSMGDFVRKGDILYRYNNSELDTKIFDLQKKGIDILLDPAPEANISINEFNKNIEFVVRSRIDGIVKEININIGDYITKDQYTMVLESSEAYVESEIKVPSNLIGKIIPGIQAQIRINSGLTLSGFVKDVAPVYDNEKNLLSTEILISGKELSRIDIKNIATGTPVEVIVISPDPFSQLVKGFVSKININIIRRYLSYEI